MSSSSVYWLFDATCADVEVHGYVGIAKDVAKRVRQHVRHGRFPTFQVKIIFTGSRADCSVMEKLLRPVHSIGWNLDPGGPKGRGCNLAPSTREKISRQKLGKPRPDVSERNRTETMRAATANRSLGNGYSVGKGYTHTGWKHDPGYVERMAESLKGNQNAKGGKSKLGQTHSDATRAKMRAASALRWARHREQRAAQ